MGEKFEYKSVYVLRNWVFGTKESHSMKTRENKFLQKKKKSNHNGGKNGP